MEEENISVVVRIRPLQSFEKENGETSCVKAASGGKEVHVKVGPQEAQVFSCNKCFGKETKQTPFFEESGITSLLDSAIEGYKVCAFAFGQTGAGKTYTVVGPWSSIIPNHENDGMLGRSLNYIFDKLDCLNTKFTVKISCLEIYHEHVYDLFSEEKERTSLQVREHQTDGFFLEGSKLIECATKKAAFKQVLRLINAFGIVHNVTKLILQL